MTDGQALPHFLVIGAGRSGTTALQYWLMQHPQVFMCPIKETNFFSFEHGHELTAAEMGFPLPDDEVWVKDMVERAPVSTLQEYAELFEDAKPHQVLGEISPSYLFSPRAPERIRHHVPDVQLIVLLRHPVERAYSAFVQKKRIGAECASTLTEFLSLEAASVQRGVGGPRRELRVGMYHSQLRRYYGLFPEGNIRVYLYEQLQADARGLLRDVFKHIRVDPDFLPDMSVRYNASGAARSPWLDRLIRRRSRVKTALKRALPSTAVSAIVNVQNRIEQRNLSTSELGDGERRALTERYFRDDILRTQRLIGRDLSHWFV